MKIITKQEAKEQGLKRYFTGLPCKYGHISERSVSKSDCIECKRIRSRTNENEINRRKEYAIENKEKTKEYLKEYYQENKEFLLDKAKQYFYDNKEKIYDYKKEWVKTEAGIINRKKGKANRRAREQNGSLNASELKILLKSSNGKCYWCNSKINKNNSSSFHFDHYIPLAKGGENVIENIVISCPLCNMKKKAKDPLEFANNLGRLL